MIDISERLRRLPAIGALLERPELVSLLEELPRDVVLGAVQQAVAEARAALQGASPAPADGSGSPPSSVIDDAESLSAWVVSRAAAVAGRVGACGLRRVVNATGVVLHTNLGRAVLSADAVAAVAEAASRYTNLEYDLFEGKRGSRQDHLRSLIISLAGSQDGMAVNNNAGAVLLMLNTIAEGREVIVSRGELVEIGGSFRIPDIMGKSGAQLVEVGTTNRTHPDDYRRAIGPRTGLLLKVHKSNYRIVGFSAEVAAAELAAIGAESGIPLLYDLGSGAAHDYAASGMPGEPTLKQAVSSGAAVVTASGDKLLGGPQAGIIAGRRELLALARRNPLARVLRLDKLTIAGLQTTLQAYLKPPAGTGQVADVPVVEMITRPVEDVQAEAESLARAIRGAAGDEVAVEVIRGSSEIGGGAFPAVGLRSWLVALVHPAVGASELTVRLREAPVPVIARVERDRVVLDPRTLLPGDAERVVEAVRLAVRSQGARGGETGWTLDGKGGEAGAG